LPDDAVRVLEMLHAYDGTTPEATARLDWYLRQLRDAGWTLRACAEPLGVTPTRVMQRVKRAREVLGVPAAPTVPVRPEKPRRPAPPELTRVEMARLRALREEATLLRRHPEGHPFRVASEELTRVLDEHQRRGVSYAVLARAVGVSKSAVALRVQAFRARQVA